MKLNNWALKKAKARQKRQDLPEDRGNHFLMLTNLVIDFSNEMETYSTNPTAMVASVEVNEFGCPLEEDDLGSNMANMGEPPNWNNFGDHVDAINQRPGPPQRSSPPHFNQRTGSNFRRPRNCFLCNKVGHGFRFCRMYPGQEPGNNVRDCCNGRHQGPCKAAQNF